MRKPAIWLTSSALILYPLTSEARVHHGGVGTGGISSCAQPTDNGCLLAQSSGSLKSTSLLTSAQQSGQTSRLPSRAGGSLTLNIPGVDYWTGYNTALTLKDPRTINDGICAWTGSQVVLCHASFAGQVVHEAFDGYDWCNFGGLGVVSIYAYDNAEIPDPSSTLTLTNNKFCIPAGGTYPAVGVNTHWNIIAKYNQFDGTTADALSKFAFAVDTDGAGDYQDVEYNAFINQGVGRIAGGATSSAWILKYNYISGLNDLITTNHGELTQRNCAGARGPCTASDDYEGNFIVWSCCLTWPVGYGNNATVFPGDGSSDGVSLTSFTLKDNIIVTNTSASGGLQPDQALFNSRLATMGVVTITGNWVDATGSNDCSVSGVKSGGNSVTASSSGNTLTVTGTSGSFGNNPIEPGWLIIHSGFTTTPITAYGTGGGNLGTYTFGGAAQNLPSDSLWTLVPGYSGVPTLAPNWNLAGSGAPVAMGLNGPQFTATHCSPWY